MGKRQLLFVTYRDENLEEGVSYAIELAKAMYEDITLLFVQKQSSLMDKLGNLMTAVSFAEAGEHDTARQIMTGGQVVKGVYEKEVDTVREKMPSAKEFRRMSMNRVWMRYRAYENSSRNMEVSIRSF